MTEAQRASEIRYEENQRARGLERVKLWVPAGDRDEIRSIARAMREGRYISHEEKSATI